MGAYYQRGQLLSLILGLRLLWKLTFHLLEIFLKNKNISNRYIAGSTYVVTFDTQTMGGMKV